MNVRDLTGRDELRDQLLAGLPVTGYTVELAGIPTAVVAGGWGPPLVLLHGPCGNATHWTDVLPDLVARYRVLVPDLPGHGASGTGVGPLTRDRVLGWLDALIEHAGPDRSVLVGHALGGALAARYAAGRSDRLAAAGPGGHAGAGAAATGAGLGAEALDNLLGPIRGTAPPRSALAVLRLRLRAPPGAGGGALGARSAPTTSPAPAPRSSRRPSAR